jgi:hypothetical protein
MTFQTIRKSSCFRALSSTALAAMVCLSASCLTGCEKDRHAGVAKSDGVVGIRLDVKGTLLEIAVQTRPKVDDKQVATTVTGALAKPLTSCLSNSSNKGLPLQLELAVNNGSVGTPVKGASPLARCLYEALAGKKLAGCKKMVRVRLQMRTAKK